MNYQSNLKETISTSSFTIFNIEKIKFKFICGDKIGR